VSISDVALPLMGGVLIGAASLGLMLLIGRIAGISGVLGGVLTQAPGQWGWRPAFLTGLVLGGAALLLLFPPAFPTEAVRSLPVLAVAGALVGFGTRLGGGCTSGHGVCGMSRLSTRSIVATLTFMVAGVAAVYLFDHTLGAP
jgi:uncharacterized membrane protein YedE/YeeE